MADDALNRLTTLALIGSLARAPMTCEWRTSLYGQSEPCESCGAEKWHACVSLQSREQGQS